MRLPKATAVALGLVEGGTKRRKYGNEPQERRAVGFETCRGKKLRRGDVIRFDSKREAARYDFHVARWRAKEITALELQRRFDVVDSGRFYYLADFCVTEAKGRIVVEDVKSKNSDATATRLFKLKAELVKERHGIDIVII